METEWSSSLAQGTESKPLPSLVDGAKKPMEPEQKPATERYQLANKYLKEKTVLKELVNGKKIYLQYSVFDLFQQI